MYDILQQRILIWFRLRNVALILFAVKRETNHHWEKVDFENLQAAENEITPLLAKSRLTLVQNIE